MAFHKQIKNNAYHKRYQVKYRRRREGKTDYYARQRLVAQDKNKYNSPKYRLVVRSSNKDVVCQIVRAKIVGDEVVAAAYSHELKDFGFPIPTTNYAATYATGLLLARRLLTNLKLADKYVGQKEIKGEDYNVEALEDGPKPFNALLDVGLSRTTTGSRVFAALKGATDGGLEIPHKDKRFVGYDKEEKKLRPDLLRKYIFGGHVADYMKLMKGEDPEKYQKHFSRYIKAGVEAEKVEATWTKVHANIRANPAKREKPKKPTPAGPVKRYKRTKLSLAQRKDRVRQKVASRAKKAAEAQ